MACNDATQRLNAPYPLGALLAVNAIPDAHFLMDGAECSMTKPEFIHGNHDLASTLLSSAGAHRVAHTYKDFADIVRDREPEIGRSVKALMDRDDCGLVFFSPRPCCSILAVDYPRIFRTAAADCAKPVLRLPADALTGDWLDGYADALAMLADIVDLKGAKPNAKKVAIVGYMMDRAEPDHLGNIAELRRLLAALGLELVSVWLGGDPYGKLSAVKDAGTILSLPYGRKAAQRLGERLKVPVVELELPFGLLGAEAWVRSVAEACGRPARKAEALIEAELAPVLKQLAWVVPQALLHKRVALAADPHLFTGLVRLAEDLGLEVAAGAVMAHRGKLPKGLGEEFPELPRVLCEPTGGEWAAELAAAGRVDLLVANSLFMQGSPAPANVELGYPSYGYHALTSAPFLGFAGALKLVERMLNATLSRDVGSWGVVMRNPVFEGAGPKLQAETRRKFC